MIKLRPRQLFTLLLLAALSSGSLSSVASLDLPLIVKWYALLMPVQLAALLYVAHRYQVWRRVM